MIFWVLFPVIGGIWMDRSNLGLAKLAYPFYAAYYTKFMVLALQKAGGFEYEDALDKIAEFSSKGSNRHDCRNSLPTT